MVVQKIVPDLETGGTVQPRRRPSPSPYSSIPGAWRASGRVISLEPTVGLSTRIPTADSSLREGTRAAENAAHPPNTHCIASS
jgi:hypothetical protein